MKRAAAAVLACLLFASCAPVDLLNQTIPTEHLFIARGIPYAPGPRHSFDVYRPLADAGPLPVAVFFYGGDWTHGAKSDYLFVAATLAERGILVVVPDYRLAPDATYPAFLDDAARAVATVRQSAPSWGGDPRRVFVVGYSAGAYNAVMLALDPAFLAAAGDSRDNLAGAVGIAGPYDFLPITDPEARAAFGAYADSWDAQPITHADGHAPPLLLLQGEADDTVSPRNATVLADRIHEAGGSVIVRLYPGVGHVGAVLGFAPWFQDRSTVLADTADFILNTPPLPIPPQR